MFLKIIIAFYLFTCAFTSYIDTVTLTFPFRAGSVIISNGNGTYFVNYNVAFQNTLNVFMPALGISTLEYQNTATNKQYIFDFDVKQYNPEDRNSFKIITTLSSNTINCKIKYFVGTTNQTHLFFLSLRDNQKTKVADDTSQTGPTQTYTQNLVSKYAGVDCFSTGLFFLLCLAQKAINDVINFFTGSSNMAKAVFQGDISSNAYTQLKLIILIKQFKAKSSQTNGWFFEAYSNTNNMTNLKLNITFSNSLTDLKYNFSVILYNVSSKTTQNYQIKYIKNSVDNDIQSFTYDVSDFESSIYYLTGVTLVNIKNSSKFSFQFQTSTQFLFEWNSKNTKFHKYQFAVVGFFHKQCLDPLYPFLMMNTQKCYDSCPDEYYSNTTQCLKCQIQYPCVTCEETSTNCTSCDPISKTILKDGLCVACQSNQYFNQTLLNCIICPTGCEVCTNDSYCTNCYLSMKMVLVQNVCTACDLKTYFQQLSLSCLSCPINCTICQNSTSCSQCDNSNAFYLVVDSCPKCDYSGYYFDYSLNICNNCELGCLNCTSLQDCTLCDQSLELILNDGRCQSCEIGYYYNSGYCVICPVQCYSCKSMNICTQCILDYTLRSGLCLNCSDQINIQYCPIENIICKNNNTFKTKANKCESLYQLQVTMEQDINTFTLCCSFNLSKQQEFESIIRDYNIYLFLRGQDITSSTNIVRSKQQFQICLTYTFEHSHTNSFLELKFINNTLTDRIINPQYYTSITAPHVVDVQKDMYQTLSEIMQFIKSNSGAGVAAMVATSSLSFFIGFIQFAQITSLYIFIDVQIPISLRRLLSTIIDVQGCPLLPFQVPTLIVQQQFQVKGQQKYQQYQIDLYFLRSNLGSLIETLIYISIYFFLFTLLKCIRSKNIVFKFFKIRVVDRFYSNCIISLQAIIIIIAFSASATITTFDFQSLKHMTNYFTGTVFIFICLAGIFVNVIVLMIYKKQDQIDTQDVYPGIERNRKGAQMYTMLRIFTLLVIAICIPLLHIFYLIGMSTIFLSLQLYIILSNNLFKYKIQKYLRVLHTLCFLLFNWNFLGFYALQYYPNISIDISSKMGLGTIVLLLMIYVLDLIQAIIDIGDILYEKVIYLCNKFKKKKFNNQNQHVIPGQVQTAQEFKPNLTNYHRRKGTFNVFSQNKQIQDKYQQNRQKQKFKNHNNNLQVFSTSRKHKIRRLKVLQMSQQNSHKNLTYQSQNSTPMTKTPLRKRIGLFGVTFTNHV